MRDHGKAVDQDRQCEAPVRGQRNRRCLNRPLLGEPFSFRHSYEAGEPKGAPEPGYEWYPLRNSLGRRGAPERRHGVRSMEFAQ